MTALLVCGFECGATGYNHVGSLTGNASIVTTNPRTGLRHLRVTGDASASYASIVGTGGATRVFRVYFRFVSNLPNNDFVISQYGSNSCRIIFKQSDGKVYCAVGSTLGATGISIVAGAWYCLEARFQVTAGDDVCDARINGVALGQATAAGTSGSPTSMYLGYFDAAQAGTIDFDDLIESETYGDYPFGAGYIKSYIPNGDGTHNVAGSNDFERSTTGTDITNSTTDSYLLIAKRPINSDLTTFINLVAPPNATDYVENTFEESAEASAPTVVDALIIMSKAGALANNLRVALRDTNGATQADIFNANVPSTGNEPAHLIFTTIPGSANSWTTTAFNALVSRCYSSDAAPDPYFKAIMLEANFASGYTTIISPPSASLTLTAYAPVLTLTNNIVLAPPSASLTLTAYAPEVTISQLGNQIANSSFETDLTGWSVIGTSVESRSNEQAKDGSWSLKIDCNSETGGMAYTCSVTPLKQYTISGWIYVSSRTSGQVNLDVENGVYGLDTNGIIVSSADNEWIYYSEVVLIPSGCTTVNVRFFGDNPATLVAYLDDVQLVQGALIVPQAASLSLTTVAPSLKQTLAPSSASLTLTAYAPDVIVTNDVVLAPPAASLTLTSYAPDVIVTNDIVLAPTSASLTLTAYAPTITLAITIAPPSISLTLTAYAPTILLAITLAPPSASLTLTSYAPAIEQTIRPSSISLALTAYAPAIRQTIRPSAVSLTLTSYAPTVLLAISIAPPAASLALTSYAPNIIVTNDITLAPPSTSLALTASAPSIRQAIRPQSSLLTLTSYAPTVLAAVNIIPISASLTLTAYAPTILLTQDVFLHPLSASLTLTSYAPAIRQTIRPSSTLLSLVANAPIIRQTIRPLSVQLTLTSQIPTVKLTIIIVPTPTLLTLVAIAPIVLNPVVVRPVSTLLHLTSFAPNVTSGALIINYYIYALDIETLKLKALETDKVLASVIDRENLKFEGLL